MRIYDINGQKIQTGATIATGKVTFAKAVNTPGTFYTYGDNSSYDWASPNNYTSKNWNNISNASGKTFFDPCPQGWRLPTKEEYSDFSTSNYMWDNFNNGRNYNSNWFPTVGYRYGYDGQELNENNLGCYWSSTPNKKNYGYYLGFSSKKVYPDGSRNRAYGFAVRCIKE